MLKLNEKTKWFEQFIPMPESITTEKIMNDQFKYIRDRLRATAWSAHVTTYDSSMVKNSQMINQNTDMITKISYSHSFEYSQTQVSSGGAGHCLIILRFISRLQM